MVSGEGFVIKNKKPEISVETDALALAAYDDVFWCQECGTLLGDYGSWVPKRITNAAKPTEKV